MVISEESAIVASKEAYLTQMREFDSAGKLAVAPATVARVDRITGRLIAQAIKMRPDSADWEWSVEVVSEPDTINAWCMAGGRMAIYTGLLEKVDPTDDELAQVMGHEISHALANHTAERMSNAMMTSLGVAVVGIATDSDVAVSTAAAAATLALTLPNSRTSEREADQIGMELAAKAGYHPDAAATLWQKMGAAGGDGPPEFLSTHPSPGNRQETLTRLAPKMLPYYEASRNPPTYKIVRTGS
jgi:predicted Zn-dependent protease